MWLSVAPSCVHLAILQFELNQMGQAEQLLWSLDYCVC